VSLEVVGLDKDTMVTEGRKLAAIHENAVVKVPLTEAGLKACRALVAEGMRVNVTLCFSVSQALLAAKAGASYISPFVGRIDDISGEGMQLIHQIRQVYDNYGFATEILAASIRHPVHVVEAMMMGADCCTLPSNVLWQLTKHPLTDRGLEAFLKDWETLGARI
jgi:transaldolase